MSPLRAVTYPQRCNGHHDKADAVLAWSALVPKGFIPKDRVRARRRHRQVIWGAALLGLSLVLIWLPHPSYAQQLTLDLGPEPSGGNSLAGRTIQLFLLVSLLSILPGVMIMVTAFPFIVTVLSILRQAIGLQQAPPNMLIISLALFLTWYVMDPVLSEAWALGFGPFNRGEIDIATAINRASVPFHGFMIQRIDPDTFARLDGLRPRADPRLDQAPFSLIVPAFLISEIQRAFEIGFLIFLPFLVIDLVVSAILMSMGMMMVPPAAVALPFKLAFFVVANGWALLAEALVRSYQLP